MTLDRLSLKRRALERIAFAKPSAYLVTAVFLAVYYLTVYIQTTLEDRVETWLSTWWTSVSELLNGLDPASEIIPELPPLVITNTILLSFIFVLLLNIVSEILSIGYSSYCLHLSRAEKATFGDLLDGVNFIGKSIVLIVLQNIFIAAWSLLFFIPGIIASYRYRQAYYIFLENPELSPLECIRRSKRLMDGHKMDLFILDLSFIGWQFLCILSSGLLYIWKMPYFSVTYSNYYLALTNQWPDDTPVDSHQDLWGPYQ